jgi:hypothetical protein
LPWLVMGKDGKADFEKHRLFRVLQPQNARRGTPPTC